MFRLSEKDYTADVAAEIEAGNDEELFSESAKALNQIICDSDKIRGDIKKEFQVEAESFDMLLYNFLEHLLLLKDSESFLAASAQVKIVKFPKKLRLNVVAEGEGADPKRHDIKTDVKAITLHDFVVKHTKDGWYAKIVFDI